VGVAVAPAVTVQIGLEPNAARPVRVMRRAGLLPLAAAPVMAVVGVNTIVAVVSAPFTTELRVMVGPVIAGLVMAGNVPVLPIFTMVVAALAVSPIVAEAILVRAAFPLAQSTLMPDTVRVTAVPAPKVPAVRARVSTDPDRAGEQVGLLVAPATWPQPAAGLVANAARPVMVMRRAGLLPLALAPVMAVVGVNTIVAAVLADWAVVVMVGPVIPPIIGNVPELPVSMMQGVAAEKSFEVADATLDTANCAAAGVVNLVIVKVTAAAAGKVPVRRLTVKT